MSKVVLTKFDLDKISEQALTNVKEIPGNFRRLDEFNTVRKQQSYAYTQAVISHLKRLGLLDGEFEYKTAVYIKP